MFCNFIKKETLAQVFSCDFCENFKNTCKLYHMETKDEKLLLQITSRYYSKSLSMTPRATRIMIINNFILVNIREIEIEPFLPSVF